MERWGFLFSVMSSPIVYFLTILLAVCPNINPTILCAHVCDVYYAACYCFLLQFRDPCEWTAGVRLACSGSKIENGNKVSNNLNN